MGKGDANGLRVSLGTGSLVTNQAQAVDACHHARQYKRIAVEAAVNADGHLTAPLQLTQKGSLSQAATGGGLVLQHFDLLEHGGVALSTLNT